MECHHQRILLGGEALQALRARYPEARGIIGGENLLKWGVVNYKCEIIYQSKGEFPGAFATPATVIFGHTTEPL